MAESDPAGVFLQRFDENLSATIFRENFQKLPYDYEPTSEQSIYRIPSLLRDLDPNAYDPRVVSIGPYHYGKEQLQAMEEHKYRALNLFLSRNDGIRLDDIVAEFMREPNFLVEVRHCYTEELKRQWSDDNIFSRLMVLDGCFLLELLLDDCFENHAHLSYVKMDMLMLDNQIPLLVLRALARIANLVLDRPSASQPTGSENVAIQIENQNITELIWKFYGTMNDEIPSDLDDAHHVLDAYRKGCIRSGAYDGWASSLSVRELYYHGVKFRASRGGGVADGFVAMGRFKDVAFKVSVDNFIRLGDHLFNIFEPSDQSQNGQVQQNQQNHQNGQAQR